jgi:hypothetical protein
MVRTRQQRNLVRINEIRNIIEENGMKYVLIPNGIFDELYMKELDEDEQRFSELDLVAYIFLQFMMVNKFTLNYEDFAGYIGCSSKQLKVALKRLREFRGKVNAKYSAAIDKVKLIVECEVPLISEKTHSAYNPKLKKNIKKLHWYTNFIPYYKQTKKVGKEINLPYNFFMITIEDFDLLTNGTLSRNEFITYLYLLKTYKYGANDESQMYWKLSTIAENLQYKMTGTIHKHIEKLLDLKIGDVPLLEEIKPKNYNLQILKGEEPSSRFIPRYNTSKMMEMDFGKQEMSSEEMEMSFEKLEMDSKKVEMGFSEEEMNSPEWEMTFG